uniref:Large ribosomal subunit protein uL2 C-terminal domain-containing protein n=1 Tax=Mustela putorius furo TaxID=9669 RepID=M3YWP8_MUSPF
GLIKGTVKDVLCDPAGAPLAKVVFQDPYQFKKQMVVFIIMEGIHTDHFMYCNKKAQLNIGNVLLVGIMPWGTIVCCLEEKLVDWGKLPQGLGNYVTVMSHPRDQQTQVKLPSRSKKVIYLGKNCSALSAVQG